jgi:hypothetical protein
MGGKLALAIALWPLLAVAAEAQPGCANTPAYTPCEMVFELSAAEAAAQGGPYASVEMRVEFRSPRHRTYALPAYWDGGTRMVARFAPVEAGEWDYRVVSNLPSWNGKMGTFTAAASDAPGFIREVAVHHWAYSEGYRAHLWVGANLPQLAGMDEAAFREAVDRLAEAKLTHVRFAVLDAQTPPGIDLGYFARLDERVRYLNQKGLVADLVLAPNPSEWKRLAADARARRRLVRYLVGRYAAFQVTWEAMAEFEGSPGGRQLASEIGGYLKEADGYSHPRSTGARLTSAPLLDDKWMTFASYGTYDQNLGAIERQIVSVPTVSVNGETSDAAALRHRLWNATMSGQSVTWTIPAAALPVFKVWYDVMSDTRYWEMEPYFDTDNGRALALEDTDYIVYVEKPAPIELVVEKHGYEVYWIDPATGERTKQKFRGDHFTGQPPAGDHDWVLRLVREGRVVGMSRSYKFLSRETEVTAQEIEQTPAKVPFAISEPAAVDCRVGDAVPLAARMTRQSHATRTMRWLWTGEVAAGNQGYRVLGTSESGTFRVPPELATALPAQLHVRLYGMNANGKVYATDTACEVKP